MTHPYDEYIAAALDKHVLYVQDEETKEKYYEFSGTYLRSLLADAWIAGLTYSLKLIEKESHDRKVNS